MLQLRVYADATDLDGFGHWLESSGHARHTVVVPALADIHSGLLTAAIGGMLHLTGRLPTGFSATTPALSGLVRIGVGTIGVALAAGVAAMLALETRASAAVGVAISVTTIPAAAYFGVALAVDQFGNAGGALAVLGVNVAMLLIAGTATLALLRWLNRRAVIAATAREGSP